MKFNKKFIALIIIFLECFFFSGATVLLTTHYKNTIKEPSINFVNLESQMDKKNWQLKYQGIDRDGNGISDDLDSKLNNITSNPFVPNKISVPIETEILDEIQSNTIGNIEDGKIGIVVKSTKKNLDLAIQLFKDHRGEIKSNFSPFLNAFGGIIKIEHLESYRQKLQQSGILFFIEEDGVAQVQLYYTGRNMNLRPYVWNTLRYDGDDTSAIAIIDTGIDETHPMHMGFSNRDYSAKVVGWHDEINNIQSAPYDDNGHGSHCAGISAGQGNPTVDGLGRTVATNSLHYTGYYTTPRVEAFNFAAFNVTSAGPLNVYCEFDDFTTYPDFVFGSMHLYHDGVQKAFTAPGLRNWVDILSYTVPNNELGAYYLEVRVSYQDGNSDGYVTYYDFSLRASPRWFFNEDLMSAGNVWRGVAGDTHLVGVKVLDAQGRGTYSDVINGVNWVIANKEVYNITTISMSLGGSATSTTLIDAVNNAVNEGIVVVTSAGNGGSGSNHVSYPGNADNVISVAAMNHRDQITFYSSQGGNSYTGKTTKPDITAPGGSPLALQVFSTDTNDNDANGQYADWYNGDQKGSQGTSMACPAVAGAANLLIEAMGGRASWTYTADQAKLVKALLLMTATETYPLLRETETSSTSPLLNRGGKDVHEGYGRINVDIAIEAYTQELTAGNSISTTISSSVFDPFTKHGFGCYVDLIRGKTYNFQLNVPIGADFDLYLYNDDPTAIGEPVLEASSISSVEGEDELLLFIPSETGRYYLILKAISGSGLASLDISKDLSVSLGGVPSSFELGVTYTLSASVLNEGSSTENNVNIILYIDDVVMNSDLISSLPSGSRYIIYYDWTPTIDKIYNITAYVPPILSEYSDENNRISKLISRNSISLPVHEYKLDETSGTTAYDLGTIPVDGTCVDALIDQAGKIGRCYHFDGNDSVSFPSDSSFTFTDQITLSAWIKPDKYGGSIIGKIYTYSIPWAVYDLASLFSGACRFFLADSTGTTFAFDARTTTVLPLNEWTMVTCVYTGNVATSKIYFNGVEQPLEWVTGMGGDMLNVPDPFFIGMDNKYGLTGFTGYIDEVKIFDTALTSEEVLELSKHPILPVHEYKLDETSGTTAYDLGTIPVDGTCVDALIDQAGKIGRCYHFDGNDSVSFPSDSSFTFTDQITLSAWIKPDKYGGSIIGKIYTYSIPWAVYDLASLFSGACRFFLADSTGTTFAFDARTTTVLPLNEWTMVTCVYTGNVATSKIYFNGVEQPLEWVTGMGGDMLNVPDPFFIGMDNKYGLTGFTGYIDEVKIFDTALTSEEILDLTATPTITIPRVPLNLQAIASDEQVVLTWEAPDDDGGSAITNYRIYRGTTSGGETLLTTVGNVLTYTDINLTNGQTYYYMVIAVNTNGNSLPSNEANATPESDSIPGFDMAFLILGLSITGVIIIMIIKLKRKG
ncbi:MAG: LamG-like jellyroll fold domain-containing protein [Promethearchaeota archaeon]